MSKRAGWSREFDEPIMLPDGRQIVSLRDAATYVTGLPKKEAAEPEWQAAIEALMLVADLGGPTMFARVGVMQALNRGHVREPTKASGSRTKLHAFTHGTSCPSLLRRTSPKCP
jgi:hypothetical protein